MRNKGIFLIYFFLMCVHIAYGAQWQETAQNVQMEVAVQGSFELQPTSSSYSIQEVDADLFFIPSSDERQHVNSIITSPKAQSTGNSFLFSWENPSQNQITFGYTASVSAENYIPPLKIEVPFPMRQGFSPEVIEYTKPSKNIDSYNPLIVQQAKQIVQSEDDMYGAVFSLAYWVKQNVNYSLSTLTADISQPASWVLENKVGVCDELTSLFIAMARSQGIPARFVSGLAYTSHNDLNDWGAHGWAEVYFPTVGWVPFDITYGQFGYVDASHISLKKSIDSDEASTKFKWLGKDAELNPGELSMRVQRTSLGQNLKRTIPLSVESKASSITFGSYNLIWATVENPYDYYVSFEIFPSVSEGMTFLENPRKIIYLKPNEQKKVYWIVKLDGSFDSSYAYTYKVSMYTPYSEPSSVSFTVQKDGAFYDLDSLKKQVLEEQKASKKPYTFFCIPSKDLYYTYDEVLVNCVFKNTENEKTGVRICIRSICQEQSVSAYRESTVLFSLGKHSAGKRELQAEAVILSSKESTSMWIPLFVLDVPAVNISNITFSSSIGFSDTATLHFVLMPTGSTPKNVVIVLDQNGRSIKREFSSIDGPTAFDVTLTGKDLYIAKEKTMHLLIEYQDKNGKTYSEKKSIGPPLQKLTFVQKVQVQFYRLVELFVS